MSITKILTYFGALLLVATMLGCNPTSITKKTTGAYSLYIMQKDGTHALLQVDSLTDDSMDTKVASISIPASFDRSIILKDGFFYHMDTEENSFNKYRLTIDGLQKVAGIRIVDTHIENKVWVGQDTLLLLTLDDQTYRQVGFYKIDMKHFSVVSSGTIPLDFPSTAFKTISIGFSNLDQDKLLFGYCFNKILDSENYTTIDTMYVATLGYPSMELQSIEKDSRSAYPGGINTIQSYSFEDEYHNFYFMSCPGIALGNNLKMPTAIFKINTTTDLIDRDYMVDISRTIGNHAYGMWYLGNGEVLIRSERKDRYKDFSDHHSTYHFEYYRVNLQSGKMTKLSLPFDKGTRKESVVIDNNKAYIGIDDSTDTHQIWVYDIGSTTISKGLKLTKETDFILRIDKM
ncbi:hypothetical protein [Sphingobacterium sp. SYP-B4668]|uniref:hypothetical protein n=1 Tax=Sphingobacterium sp. SYP-B4668 TaxID=2996035 RepID=UPI0022DDF31C|nr:hypothetical protein [Sphingobacterium sp. SYP-B4668]